MRIHDKYKDTYEKHKEVIRRGRGRRPGGKGSLHSCNVYVPF